MGAVAVLLNMGLQIMYGTSSSKNMQLFWGWVGGWGGGVLMNVFVQWQQHGGCLKFSLAFGVTVW